MKTKGSRFRWIACIATLLLLCIVGSDRPGMGAEPAPLTASQCTFVAEETAGGAVLTYPVSDTFTHLCETNRWGLFAFLPLVTGEITFVIERRFSASPRIVIQ